MGNDIFWKGRQPNLKKQKQCSFVLDRLFKEVGFFYKPYNGLINLPVMDIEQEKYRKVYKNIQLCGISSWHIPSEDNDFNMLAEMQFSFVFNNSEYLQDNVKGTIITYEEIDKTKVQRHIILQRITKNRKMLDNKCGVYSNANYIRVLTEKEMFIFKTLYMVKLLFVPNISVSDDYGTWKYVVNWGEEIGFYEKFKEKEDVFSGIKFCLKMLYGIEIDELFYFNEELLKYWGLSKSDFFESKIT